MFVIAVVYPASWDKVSEQQCKSSRPGQHLGMYGGDRAVLDKGPRSTQPAGFSPEIAQPLGMEQANAAARGLRSTHDVRLVGAEEWPSQG